MKAKISLISSTVVLSMASLAASAEEASTSFSWGDVTFQPRAYAGYADYELKSENFTFTPQDGTPYSSSLKLDLYDHNKLQFSGLVGGIGGTVAVGKFFGDIYYQSTLNETAYSGFPKHEESGDVIQDIYYGDVKAQHRDWALSFGYAITDQWSIFAGYKSGNTKWNQTDYYHTYQQGYGNSNFINRLNNKFEQDGPFLGTSYSLPIGPGSLNFKAAYAYLDGVYNYYENWMYYPHPGDEGYQSFLFQSKLDGNSNAFSFGVSWVQLVTENLGFSVGANYHRYKFDLSGRGVQNTYFGNDHLAESLEVSGGDLTEELFTLTAAVIYRF